MKTQKSAQRSPTRGSRTAPENSSQTSTQLDGLMHLMTHDTGKAIQFEIAAEQDSKVFIAGTFNNWNPTAHPLSHHPEEGVFKATLHLPAGKHEYKFVVNGVWQCDGKCPQWSPNEHGSLNSVLEI